MSLVEKSYSILLISSGDQFKNIVVPLLPHSSSNLVKVVNSISMAKRACLENSYDLILINSPLPDDAGIRFAIDQSSGKTSIVLFFARNDSYEENYTRLTGSGVFLVRKPINRPVLVQSLEWIEIARNRLMQVEASAASVEEKIQEIRIVNRAKWTLINQLKMTEPDAHRYIEKQAMDSGITKIEVAQKIIEAYK